MGRMPYLCTAIRKERAITLRYERASNLIPTTEYSSKLPSQNSVAFTNKMTLPKISVCSFPQTTTNAPLIKGDHRGNYTFPHRPKYYLASKAMPQTE